MGARKLGICSPHRAGIFEVLTFSVKKCIRNIYSFGKKKEIAGNLVCLWTLGRDRTTKSYLQNL